MKLQGKRKGGLIVVLLGLTVLQAARLLADVTVTEPIGGNDVSADTSLNSTNGAGFTALGDIVIAEGLANDFPAGKNQTLILTLPYGWRFNTAAAVSVSYLNNGDINKAGVSVTESDLTLTFTVGGTTKFDQLTISGLQVQPLDGSQDPNAGYIVNLSSNPGTTFIPGIDEDVTTFGLLYTIPGTPKALRIVAQPSGTATAGVTFHSQPDVWTFDQFGNQCYLDASTIVQASLASGTGPLQGTTNELALGGDASFSDLSINVAGTITLQFSAANMAGVTSTPIVVGAGPANRLAFRTQPGLAASGFPFGVQPMVQSQDQFGNFSTVGLPASQIVTMTISSGIGLLLGSANIDIGTGAGNGVATYTDLEIDILGNKQLRASSAGLSSAVSSLFAVSATFTRLLVLAPGETLAPGSTNGKTGVPAAQVAGSAFTVTVNAVDSNWNLVTNVTDSVGITSSDPNAILPASAALVNGVKTFSVTFKTAGSSIVTASDLTNPTKTASVSTAIPVNPAAFARLQLLLPGETPAPATASGKTGAPIPQTGGAAFNVTVNAVDTNWNLINTNDTVALGSSDANAALPANAALVSGTRSLTITLKTAGNATVTASDVTHAGIAGNTSPAISVNAGAFSKLQILAPGETAAPGTTVGKVGTPTARIAGSAFNLTVNAVDSNWNLVTTVSDTVGITSSDPNAGLPASAPLAGGTLTFGMTLITAGSATAAASDLTDNTKTANASPAITVLVGPFAKLQILAPGEAAAPGSGLGKTGVPLAQIAGTAFNVTVNAVDAFWNLVGTNDTVAIACSDANALLPANAALVGSTKAFSITIKTAGNATTTASDVTHSGISSNNSFAIPVNAGSFTKLQLLLPGETAAPGTTSGKIGTPTAQIAGSAFNVTVNAVDANWNLINTNDTVAIATSDANTTLPANAALISGTGSFSLTLKTAGSTTVTASDITHSGITVSSSPSVAVNAGTFTKLQLLVPGETAAPGTSTGKSGTSVGQNVGAAFTITVNAVDASWNLVNTAADTVHISSSDSAATLPANATLAAGTQTFSLTFGTTNSQTVTASDFTDGSKTTSTSAAIAVGGALQYIAATGAGAISADGASGTFTSITGPIYSEKASGNAGLGTIILKPPSGFVFDTGGTAPTVKLTSTGSGSKSINGASSGSSLAMSSVTATQLTFTVTRVSSGGALCTLTWTNVRVRPTVGAPLASGNLIRSGTATVIGMSSNANVGVLREVAGAARSLAIQTQPSASAMAGAVFPQQPVVQVRDQFGNLRNAANGASDNTTVVTAARGAGSGNLQGTLSATASNGVVNFTNLSHNVATNITLLFSGAGLTNATSSVVTIVAAALSTLGFTTQPANATAGSAFGTQPVIQTQDRFGNNTAAGLPASLNVTISLSSGTGPLQGTTTMDIGSAAGNGTVALSNLRIDAAGNKQLSATASGISSALSSIFTVNPAATALMVVKTQPASATAGVAFSPVPVIQLLDALGNPATTDSSTTVTVTRNLGSGALQGVTSLTAVSGLVTFSNLSYNIAETINLNFASPGLTTLTSANVTVNPASASRLVIQTQPSASATAGLPFAQQPVIAIQDAYGNVRSSDNSTVITAARNAGSGTLQGTLTATVVNGAATFVNLSHNLANTINLSFSSSGLTNATSANIQVSPAGFTQLQLLVPGEIAAPGTASGKTGTPTAQSAFTSFKITVNAVDANWNLINSITDNVGITSAAATAITPVGAALAAGTQTFTLAFNTNGAFTLTASDLSDSTKAPNTCPAITVNAVQFSPATGGSAISADTTGGSFTTLTGPSYTENTNGSVGVGTVILNAPAGFIFDTGGIAPTVAVTRAGGTGSKGDLVGSVSSVTTTQIIYTVKTKSVSVTDKLTWQNVRVRPKAGTPLASGNLSVSGTAIVAGLSTNSIFGNLREVAGTARSLAILSQPSATATAGIPFAQQPALQVKDQFGNVRNAGNGTSDNATVVTATRGAGTGMLQGSMNITTVNGVASFTNLSYNLAETITINFSSGSLSNATSSSIVVSSNATSTVTVPGPTMGTSAAIVSPAPGKQPATLTGIQVVTNGVRLTFSGNANSIYQVQRAAALQGSATTWEEIGAITTDASGQGEFTDTNPPPGQGYYRTMSP